MDNALKVKIGQRLIAGFPGYEMSKEFTDAVREYKIGNIILFSRNIKDWMQLKKLCMQITELVKRETGEDPFIMIDQEGGGVTRIADAQLNVPGQMALAGIGDPQMVRRAAEITAQELRSCGINMNLAPVMDINSNPNNPIIGARSYGEDAETVAGYGVCAVEGYQKEKIACCLKHFPGHGDTAVDSHLGLPVVDKSLEDLARSELIPFQKGMEAGAPAIMTTHILFPQIESGKIPATMSRAIINGLLREKMGYKGMIISDCMEMNAIAQYYGTVHGAVEAIKAGVDLICISHTVMFAIEAAQQIYQDVQAGRISIEEFEQSVARIHAYKEQYCSIHGIDSEMEANETAVRQEIAQMRFLTIRPYRQNGIKMPAIGSNPLFIGCEDYRTANVADQSGEAVTFSEYMKTLAGCGQAIVTSQNPQREEIQKILFKDKEKQYTAVIYGLYNGHIKTGQLELAKLVAAEAANQRCPMIAVALKDPYDLDEMPENVVCVAGWEYSRPQFQQIWKYLNGNRQKEE